MNKKNDSFKFGDLLILGLIILGAYYFFFRTDSTTEQNKTKKDIKEEKTRTILIYMAPNDLESINGHGTKDLNAIDKNKFDSEHNKIVVMAGGTNYWHNGFSKETKIYGYKNGIYEILDSCINHQNMGDYNTLLYFLDYVYDHYKSDEYILYFYGHGYGVDGVLPDEIYEDNLSLKDISFGLIPSKFNKNRKKPTDTPFDLIIFNSCMIGTYETYETLGIYADYAIASEEITWSVQDKPIFNYFNEIKSTDDIVTIGKEYIDHYKDTITSIPNKYHNLAMIDLNNMNFSNLIDNLFGSIDINNNYQDIISIRRSMLQFGNEKTIDEVDLYNLMTKFSKYDKENNYKKFVEIFNKAVIYNYTNHPNEMHGISIHFPYYDGTSEDNFILENTSIYNTGKYSQFINKFIEKQKEDFQN